MPPLRCCGESPDPAPSPDRRSSACRLRALGVLRGSLSFHASQKPPQKTPKIIAAPTAPIPSPSQFETYVHYYPHFSKPSCIIRRAPSAERMVGSRGRRKPRLHGLAQIRVIRGDSSRLVGWSFVLSQSGRHQSCLLTSPLPARLAGPIPDRRPNFPKPFFPPLPRFPPGK